MSPVDSTHDSLTTQPADSSPDRLARWGVAAVIALVIGVAVYATSARSSADRRLADLEQRMADQRVTAELNSLREQNAKLASEFTSLAERLGTTADDLRDTRAAAESLRATAGRAARTAASNADALQEVRDDTTTRLSAVDTKVDGVSMEVKGVAATLATTRGDLAESRREMTASATALSARVAANATSLEELRRRGERDAVEFDIRKSSRPDTWTVADIRVELRKTDVRRSKYNVVLHVEDGRLERQDCMAFEPVAFLVGPEQLRYELVVTAVERDRIRGYVSMPKRPGMPASLSPRASR